MFQRTKICSGLLLAFGGLTTLAPSAFAQDDQSVQRVEVTGSSIKRVDAETSVPVTIIKADDLKKQGITTVEQILQSVSAVQVQQSSAQAVGLGTGGASFADMRGLGANKTLVLLNGRRIANQAFNSSAPDLNLIPFAAIERVEVLRDGASALYGTDAISGVINFITRRDYRGGTITVGVDKPQKSGGDTHSANIGFGAGDLQKDGLNLFGFVDFQKQSQVLSTQRPYYQQQYMNNGTFAPSGTTFPATWLGSTVNYPGFQEYAATPNSNGCANSQHLYQRGDPTDPTTANQCGEITSDFIDFIPETQRVSGLLRGSFKLTENHTLTLEGYLAQSKVNTRIAPVPYGALYMSPTSKYFPGNGINPLPPGETLTADQQGAPGQLNDDLLFIKYRDVVNGYREDDNTATQSRFVASLDGNVADWDYSLAASLNTNHVQDFLAHGYSDINVLATPVDIPTGDGTGGSFTGYMMNPAINPFGAQDPTGAAILASAVKQGVLQYGDGMVQQIDGHASHDLPDWLHSGRPGAVALGFEGRHERFINSANAEYAAQVIASTGVDPNTYNAGWRNVWAGYAEWNLPILKTLDFTLAARYDHYSDFGSTTNPKASFRWQPSKLFLLRGSYSTGFRAPSLYELYAAQTYTNSSGGQNDPGHSTVDPVTGKCTGTYPQACNNQFEELSGGNAQLKPEKSKNFTLGTVIEPMQDFTAEFDYYNIRFTNQIGVLADTDLFDPAQFDKFQQYYHYNSQGQLSTDGTQCPGPTCGYVSSQNQNLGGVKTDGVDIALAYRMNAASYGKFNFGLQSTWVHSYKYQNIPGGEYIENVGIFSGAGPVFRWQHNGEINWNFEPFSLGYALHYKSGYFEPAGTFANANTGANPDHNVSAYTTQDIYGTFAMQKGFSVTVGVRNFTDSKAPFTYQTNLFQTGYDARFADVLGRTYYVRGTYAF